MYGLKSNKRGGFLAASDGGDWRNEGADAYDANIEEGSSTEPVLLYTSVELDYGYHTAIIRTWGNDSRIEGNPTPIFGVDRIEYDGDEQGGSLWSLKGRRQGRTAQLTYQALILSLAGLH